MFQLLIAIVTSTAITYTVRSGDTLTSIAQLFSVTIAQIQEWNGISNPNFITVGQVLNIKEAKRTYITYTVKSGDSLSVIAANYGLTTEDLAISNMKAYPYTLYVGEVLLIPVPLPTPSRSPTASPSKSPTPSLSPLANITTDSYVVQRGDTLFSIAIEHHTTVENICIINEIKDPNLIYDGQLLQLPKSTESIDNFSNEPIV
ncbi:LysM peptidoglycan-binding domain-containing protein [Histomonas meleagridis]|uniref:LysM peptidoglycan-binding domain-containing protein n=1 Tax=Histomonas meleagridis TaxID=135588 RepID=UPI003559A168|nr:LysM peptidoglycan-binding domain-containing protein [Histomonas meleagridis]KAH0800246.1 LysM peptidoglycan-binding domain-containing protein [Histomonas meleagridis]